LTPVEAQEVWAAGVTYLRSKEARMVESEFSANASDEAEIEILRTIDTRGVAWRRRARLPEDGPIDELPSLMSGWLGLKAG